MVPGNFSAGAASFDWIMVWQCLAVLTVESGLFEYFAFMPITPIFFLLLCARRLNID